RPLLEDRPFAERGDVPLLGSRNACDPGELVTAVNVSGLCQAIDDHLRVTGRNGRRPEILARLEANLPKLGDHVLVALRSVAESPLIRDLVRQRGWRSRLHKLRSMRCF